MAQTPSLEEVIEEAVDERLQHVYTAMPGRVEEYDAEFQSVSVKPLVTFERTAQDGSLVADSLPVIGGVPVVFPGAGSFSITFPIEAGTTGLLIFANCSLDQWLANGNEVNPGSDRRHSIADAIFIPGLRPFASPIGGSGGTAPSTTAMVLEGADVRVGGEDAELAMRGETWTVAFDTLMDALNVVLSGIQNPGTYAALQTVWEAAIASFFNTAWLATNAKVK